MKIYPLFLSALFACFSVAAQHKQVCFTIDDLPVVPYRHRGTAFETSLTVKLLEKVVRQGIPAIGFVNEGKLFPAGQPDSARFALLHRWLEAGLELGNHTYSHVDFNRVSCLQYFDDITKGEVVTRPLTERFGRSLRYFRHPYLHAGETRAKADSLEIFLMEKGYTLAPVTLDNEEYLFAFAYDSALVRHDSLLMKKIGAAYIDYMEKKLHYFENQSIKLFNRNISHILLIHANLLNADYMDELASMFRQNGYSFVSLDKALEDSCYQTKVSVFGAWGISWLDRWALSKGHTGAFFKGEPETPAFIRELIR
jgi:peptidoglycan/xylan/chitin deacetylase (PgdA/CDA1 family)